MHLCTCLNLRNFKQCILPKQEYGIIFYSMGTSSKQGKLQKYQNQFLRVIFRAERRTITFSLHQRAKIIPIEL